MQHKETEPEIDPEKILEKLFRYRIYEEERAPQVVESE